ncbi:S-layer homology domain-containing protein [Clostridiaceae bacterium]|nr:S-layer homology domain-containing protein [Clostridiaceae bacterium]
MGGISMKKMKRFGMVLLSMAAALLLTAFACAAVEDTGFSDVDSSAWYADAVAYCREHGLMAGITSTTFEPESTLTRSQLAAVLYRAEGEPAVTGTDSFPDTVEGSWYSSAVLWALREGLVSGYDNGLFGTADPVTREQMTAIFWRYAGSPSAGEAGFSDAAAAGGYAAAALGGRKAAA